ncbi:MAG: Tim44/TimA family putative adaptor protein [Pseudomonadota bacterium]
MSGLIELLVLFAVAAFVLLRLKSVIGTRTGYEGTPGTTQGRQTSDRESPVAARDDSEIDEEAELLHPLPASSTAAVGRIRMAEPDFSLDRFTQGARAAYEMIVMAYEEGDRDSLRGLLSPDVFQAFEGVIAQREADNLRVEARFIGLRDIRIEGAEFDESDQEAHLTVRFVAEMITAVRDAENRVVEGDPNEIKRQTDVWTFTRKIGVDDPNWVLTATGE